MLDVRREMREVRSGRKGKGERDKGIEGSSGGQTISDIRLQNANCRMAGLRRTAYGARRGRARVSEVARREENRL